MIVIVSAITFALLSAAGGDALTALRDNPQISEKTIDRLREVYGLDKPMLSRYGTWAASAVRGDLGESMALRVPVATLVWSRFLNTLLMGLLALTMSAAAALFLAVWSTRAQSKWLDRIVELLIFLTASTPRMVLALLALVLSLSLLSAASYSYQLISGAVVLAVPLISILLAQLKNGLDEIMSEDFIRTARA